MQSHMNDLCLFKESISLCTIWVFQKVLKHSKEKDLGIE